MFVGFGYDVHRFQKGRRLILGGVDIPHERGLLGHSDADVLVHALMDALLGAAGLPDIGSLFPNDDPRYTNAMSVLLLKSVVAHVTARKLRVHNVDITVLAEQPRIAPHIPQIRKNLSAVLGLPPERIGIKATTNEKLGFIGAGEGMAAMAVALLEPLRRRKASA